MDLRGPIRGMYRYPTVVMFCEGRGIAAARALIEAGADEGGLSLPVRQDVRLYYRVRRHWFGCVLPMVGWRAQDGSCGCAGVRLITGGMQHWQAMAQT